MGSTVRTTCPYCGVGCGLLAERDGATLRLRGDPDHPANRGRLCSKGAALGETLGLEERLLQPQINGRPVDWARALDEVAGQFSRAIAAHGPDSVALYVSGQLLTEDYYVANKLMKGYIGSANIDTNSRLCMASTVAGQRRAFGSDSVPGNYQDLERADLVVIVGSNLAWCHPVLYQRLAAAKQARPGLQVVLIDPRRTATAELADLHLPIRADGDVALFLGLLAHLESAGAVDRDYLARHVTGFDAALAATRRLSDEELREQTGLAPELLQRFYALFAERPRTVTLFSQGVNQSSCGTDKVNAILNCHLATGRIGRPGSGPFSLTGQPNAMGGREVGGLANQLAAHMSLEDPAHRALVQRFWRSPRIAERPGLKAVELFDAVADGRIRALWIIATNPVDSLPQADRVQEALRRCPFLVVSDVVARNDTLRHADVLLPAAAWGEKDGTVSNSERRISRQRRFLPLPGAAQPDWWMLAQVAQRMGFADGFAWRTPAEIFAEHAALSGFANAGTRRFDISRHAAIDSHGYDALQPFQWPAPADRVVSSSRLFGDGQFDTVDGRARMIALQAPAPLPSDADFPLRLNSGRVRDHWHTLTRSGRSARLSAHLAEPFVELHPDDAAARGIADAELVRVRSARGEVLLRALISDRQMAGAIFVPIHWTDQFAARARIDTLIAARLDPHSGQPAFKSGCAEVERLPVACYGFALLRERPSTLDCSYWAIARCNGGWRLEFACRRLPSEPSHWARRLLGTPPAQPLLAYRDGAAGDQRFAWFDGERLAGLLLLAPQPVAVARSLLVDVFDQPFTDRKERYRIIAGRAAADRADPGALVCACFGVGVNPILAAARSGACLSVQQVGEQLQAGSNCGSCRAEIGALLASVHGSAALPG
jgi:assimilatory nitrate reductase catalytic subunit